MIKALIAGIWSVALLSGSLIFFSGLEDSSGGMGEDNAPKLEFIKLETMSITIVRENTLMGYLILDISFEFDPMKRNTQSAPLNLILMDSINKTVFTDKEINIERLDQFDFEGFKEKVVSVVNGKLGKEFVADMLIERLDFISYDEIKEKKLRG